MSAADAVLRQKYLHEKTLTPPTYDFNHLIDINNKYRHSFAEGGTGTGKTTNRTAVVQCRIKQGFKVIILDMQNEAEFFGLPCPDDHPMYPKLIESKRKPKGIKTHVLLPLAYSGDGKHVIHYEEIPEDWDFFLLDLYDLDVAGSDWNILMGGLSSVQEQLLKTSLLKKEPHWGIIDVYHECQKRFLSGDFGYPDVNCDSQDSEPIPMLKNPFSKESIRAFDRKIMNLNSSRFIAPHRYKGNPTPYLLNWEKEIMKRKTVTIIKLSLLPTSLMHALTNYILRKTFRMAQKRFFNGKKVPPIAFMIPEATDFFPKKIPAEHNETMPALREICHKILRRGRRHRVVFDFDTADTNSMDLNKVLAQVYYFFLFDNSKKILTDCLGLFNLINAEKLKKKFDYLKRKGWCISMSRKNPIGHYIQSPVPSCWVPLEGEDFIEIWKEMNGKLKSVAPYYEKLNKISGDLKNEMRLSFCQLKLELDNAKKEKKKEAVLSGAIREFARFVYGFSVANPEIVLKSKPINKFKEENSDAPSLMSLYNWMDKIEDFGLVIINRDKRPHTFKVTKKMKEFLEAKKLASSS